MMVNIIAMMVLGIITKIGMVLIRKNTDTQRLAIGMIIIMTTRLHGTTERKDFGIMKRKVIGIITAKVAAAVVAEAAAEAAAAVVIAVVIAVVAAAAVSVAVVATAVVLAVALISASSVMMLRGIIVLRMSYLQRYLSIGRKPEI